MVALLGASRVQPRFWDMLRWLLVGRALAPHQLGKRYGSISWGIVCATASWDMLGLLFVLAGACATAAWDALWQHLLASRVPP